MSRTAFPPSTPDSEKCRFLGVRCREGRSSACGQNAYQFFQINTFCKCGGWREGILVFLLINCIPAAVWGRPGCISALGAFAGRPRPPRPCAGQRAALQPGWGVGPRPDRERGLLSPSLDVEVRGEGLIGQNKASGRRTGRGPMAPLCPLGGSHRVGLGWGSSASQRAFLLSARKQRFSKLLDSGEGLPSLPTGRATWRIGARGGHFVSRRPSCGRPFCVAAPAAMLGGHFVSWRRARP